jgi:hypothetical protein
MECNGLCIDTSNDPNNCGACNNVVSPPDSKSLNACQACLTHHSALLGAAATTLAVFWMEPHSLVGVAQIRSHYVALNLALVPKARMSVVFYSVSTLIT